jgi:two-component system alkaline phosphatase synthesis response regulator PhoP
MVADLESSFDTNSDRPRRNVLVVEDDKDTANVICFQLLNDGYGARHVPNRDEALQVLNMYIYDYIIMDYWMPGMDAKVFATKVLQKRPNTRIVLTTAADSVKKIAADLGVRWCIPKPFAPHQVGESLERFDRE